MKLIEKSNSCQPDPYVLFAKGKYYIYATGQKGVQLYCSNSLLSGWEYVGICAYVDGQKEYWAPSVIEMDGTYYMYVSFMPQESQDVHDQAMHVLTSNSPEGPFENAMRICPPFSIDSHVVKTEKGLFMFYSLNDYEAERAGTLIVVDRLLSPTKLEGKPHEVVRATIDEEIFMRDRFRKGQHWHTLEGAFWFYKDGMHYLMYSGNCYQNEYYYVGYATAKTSEQDLTKVKFKKYPNENSYAPLLHRDDKEEGTGHNSVILDNGEYYIVYHGREKGTVENGTDLRTARIKRLVFEGEKITAKEIY